MKALKKIASLLLILSVILSLASFESKAELKNIQGNTSFTQSKIPNGSTGKIMNVTFTFTADKDYEGAWVGLAYDEDINSDAAEEKENKNTYPFEASNETLARRSIGKIKQGQSRTVSIPARVRRDIAEGYYAVQVYVADSKDGGSFGPQEYVNVWIKKATNTDKEEDTVKNASFVIGENQGTPSGKYPEVSNFNINLRNRGKITAQDVTVSMVMDKDFNIFPFSINEVNYDRHFDKIAYNETVSLPYSFAIRKETYTGYYPIKLKITYRESADGELKSSEHEFFVYIVNKDKEKSQEGDFNQNNRTKARIIIDGFKTVPEKIMAGEEFELILNMKNASSTLSASNILFSIEPEKADSKAIFSMVTGSNSVVVNSLPANASTELRFKMLSKANIDQRSYTMTIKEKYDSPEFKNAEESVSIDVPIYQVAKLATTGMSIVPDSAKVGDDINVTFAINNTGKVKLYNVMVKLKSPAIREVETYAGNIDPGQSANVDATITAIAESLDESNIKIEINYEDENGAVTTVDKDITVPINSAEELSDLTMQEDDMSKPAKVRPWYANLVFIIPLVVVILALVIFLRKRAKKKSGDI